MTAASLGEQTSPLVELHGQHEHQTLLDPQSHLLMLDEFAGLGSVREQVSAAHADWTRLQSAFDAFQKRAWEFLPYVPAGQFDVSNAYRSNVHGVVDDLFLNYWNIEKR